MEHSCAFTGHRDINPEQLEYVKGEIRREVLAAIADGYTHFLCGMARGTDLIFASVVADFKTQFSLILEAALPYPKRAEVKDLEFQRLISCCDTVVAHSEKYFPGCFAVRNKFMVQNSSRLIAAFDGQEKSGTASTIRYAKKLDRDICIIQI